MLSLRMAFVYSHGRSFPSPLSRIPYPVSPASRVWEMMRKRGLPSFPPPDLKIDWFQSRHRPPYQSTQALPPKPIRPSQPSTIHQAWKQNAYDDSWERAVVTSMAGAETCGMKTGIGAGSGRDAKTWHAEGQETPPPPPRGIPTKDGWAWFRSAVGSWPQRGWCTVTEEVAYKPPRVEQVSRTFWWTKVRTRDENVLAGAKTGHTWYGDHYYKVAKLPRFRRVHNLVHNLVHNYLASWPRVGPSDSALGLCVE